MKYVVNLPINLSQCARFCKLLGVRVRVMVSKFRKTNHKSLRNNLTKPFQFFGRVLSLLLAFFVAW